MYLLFTIAASLICFLLLKWLKVRRLCMDLSRLDGKTVLITGKPVKNRCMKFPIVTSLSNVLNVCQ